MSVTAFEYIEALGEGTSGTVYRARDGAGRELAVKVFRDKVAHDQALLKRFRREVDIALALEHQNLVATYEGGQTAGGKLFLATELLPGGDVHRLLQAARPLSERAALSIARDLFAGLAYLAERGLVHRDVKPENILLAADGTAKISDFGLAKIATEGGARVTATGEVIGTPYYLAPEQIQGRKDIDPRADLYSAGAVLYELLAGRPPFEAGTMVEILGGHLRGAIPDVRAARPDVSAGTAELIARLLAKDRDARPAGAAEAERRAAELLAALGVPDADSARAAVREAMAKAAGAAAAPSKPSLAKPTLSAEDAVLARGDRGARLKLTLCASSGTTTLFAFAGERLQLGRDGIDRSDNDVCLRVKGNDAASKKLDSKHIRLDLDASGAYVRDLETRGGTRLAGVKLAPGAKTAVRGKSATLSLSGGALELELSVVPGEGGPAALVISRPHNRTDHVYVLLRDRVLIAEKGGVAAIGVPDGSVLARGEGGLLLNGRLLAAGDRVRASGLSIEADEIRPEDMK